MSQIKQTGSVASFIIIGGILVLATAGALYWAGQQRGGDVAETGTPEVSLPSSTDDKTSEKQPGTNTSDDKGSTSTAPGKDSTTNADKPTSSKQESTPKTDSNKSQPSTGSVKELSHTGPSDSIVQIVAAGLLVGSFVAFLQSRRRSVTL